MIDINTLKKMEEVSRQTEIEKFKRKQNDESQRFWEQHPDVLVDGVFEKWNNLEQAHNEQSENFFTVEELNAMNEPNKFHNL